jgi:peroxiredoxin Q/BCP
VRELREFRESHDEFEREGVALAGVSVDSIASHRKWIERLRLPYPLISDEDRIAGRALGLVRRLGVGAWAIEFFRRATILVDAVGHVAAAWGDVKVRGHARHVLLAARALRRLPPGTHTAAPGPSVTPA